MVLFISQHFEDFEKNAVLDFEESMEAVVQTLLERGDDNQ
jgi:hypothetical protein